MDKVYRMVLAGLAILQLVQHSWAHGMLINPPSRSTMWRFEKFEKYNLTKNWSDNELFCGGFDKQFGENKGFCGICGDPYDQPQPRDNEDGGIYGSGIISRTYKSGRIIPILVNLTTTHEGYFEFRLCPEDDIDSHLKEECYENNLLEIVSRRNKQLWKETNKEHWESVKDQKVTKFYVKTDKNQELLKFKIRLPQGVSCKHCVLQWEYHTATRWGYCHGEKYGKGCGPQETFRNCADIRIK